MIAGSLNRSDLAAVFQNNERAIRTFDAMQNIVFSLPFSNAGSPVASATPSDTSIPVLVNGVQYYLKLSTTP